MPKRRSTRVRRARRSGLGIGLLVLLSITLITLDYRGDLRGSIAGARRAANDAVAPLQQGVDDVLHPIGSFLAGAVHYGTLQQENAKLRLQVRNDAGALARAQAVQRTASQLATLEHLPWAVVANIPTVTAAVIGSNPSNFESTVVLNKGTTDGVAVGNPVVDGKGLVGRVVQASRSQCTVQLLVDVRTVVSVQLGTSANLATLDGGGPSGTLAVKYVPTTVHLRRGMLLTTSGQQLGLFPRGIPVATVRAFHATPSATDQVVTATPVAALHDLAYVDVLQWEPPG